MRVERIEPRRRGPSRRVRITLAVAAAALLVVLLSLRGIARFWTDYLWFDSLGFGDTWGELLRARLVPSVVFMAVFFVLLFVNLVIAERLAPTFVPAGPEEEFVQRYREVVGPYAGRIRAGVAVLFALIAGGNVAGHWHDWILFRNRVDFGVKDPQFGRDVGFYVFQLPFLKFVFEWAFTSLIVVLLVTAVAHYLNGGIRVRSPFEKVTPAVKAHLSVLLALIALVRLAGYWLERFELSFSTRGAVHGATYTDVKAQLPALQMLMLISAVGAGLFIFNIWRRGWVLPALGVGLWFLVSLLLGEAYPAVIQRFRVEPNEFSREAPYIDRNIKATRAAFNLDEVEVDEFKYEENLTAETVQQNQGTIANARLWDPNVLENTYDQLQRIRNIYDFRDVDVDRYSLDGQVVQTLLSAREINLEELPNTSWVNQHLVFTHGYGLVMSRASSVTEDGLPDFLVKDIPPESEAGKIERPQVYFGEGAGGYTIVRTKEREFDFPRAESGGTEDVTTRYEGGGGIDVSGFLRRAAFGLRFADFRFFVSSELTAESVVLFERNVRERVEKAAPFLRFDADPYPVLVGGKLLWMLDGYTATDRYPYSQAIVPDRLPADSGLHDRVNYVRNSVKATVNAYDGTVTFYVIDDEDPIIRAYRKAFPDLFTAKAEMPDALRAHLRYPEDLFRVQTDLYSTYHMTRSREFYNRSDQWAIATDPASGLQTTGDQIQPVDASQTTVTAGGRPLSQAERSRQRMDPYYLLMRLPDEDNEAFVLLQPFTPPAKGRELGNLLSFMVAKSDPDEYGKLRAFVMPRGEQVFGPSQVNNEVLGTPEIARQFTLLSQRGSQLLQGNLQLIPVGDSILYIRPLYVQAEGETQFPQLQFVIAFYAGEAVIDATLDGALAQLFEGLEPPPAPAPEEGEPAPEGEEPTDADKLRQALDEARKAIEELQRQLEEIGSLVGAGEGAEGGEDVGETTTTSSGTSTTTSTAPSAEA
ncbi:MAG: UPF0182 family protein [Actinobacteria bacterium]|nr:UPF0182 family protein [Actinomycetota bacterium]